MLQSNNRKLLNLMLLIKVRDIDVAPVASSEGILKKALWRLLFELLYPLSNFEYTVYPIII